MPAGSGTGLVMRAPCSGLGGGGGSPEALSTACGTHKVESNSDE